ncbi:MAG: ribonuclease HI [Halovenus sp.]|uniref:ribonuclease HI n=1 Tax=Halovenus amylolytica TaxID=2500550 RepID=UPI000FE3E3AE
MPVLNCDVDQARAHLAEAGVEIIEGNTEHERWRAEYGGATAVAYDDKVVVQGGDTGKLEALLGSENGRAHVYFDGAARGNPGPAAIGWIIVTSDGIVTEGNDRIGKTTNNRAEYEALVRALEIADEYGFDEVDVRGDSELIVKQVRGEYDTNNPELREYRVRVRELLDRFEEWSLSHVPRDINERADKLANEAFEDG